MTVKVTIESPKQVLVKVHSKEQKDTPIARLKKDIAEVGDDGN